MATCTGSNYRLPHIFQIQHVQLWDVQSENVRVTHHVMFTSRWTWHDAQPCWTSGHNGDGPVLGWGILIKRTNYISVHVARVTTIVSWRDLTHCNHSLIVLELWGASRATCHWNSREAPFQYFNLVNDCSVQWANRTRHHETTVRCKNKVAVLFGTKKNSLWLVGTCWLYQWASLANTWTTPLNVSTTMKLSASVAGTKQKVTHQPLTKTTVWIRKN